MFLLIASLLVAASCSDQHIENIVKCVIKTCPGCRLNHLPEVKRFVKEIAPSFSSVEVRYISGHEPIAFFLDAAGNELETLPLAEYNAAQLVRLFKLKGFQMKEAIPRGALQANE